MRHQRALWSYSATPSNPRHYGEDILTYRESSWQVSPEATERHIKLTAEEKIYELLCQISIQCHFVRGGGDNEEFYYVQSSCSRINSINSTEIERASYMTA